MSRDYAYEGKGEDCRAVPLVDFVYPDDEPAAKPSPALEVQGDDSMIRLINFTASLSKKHCYAESLCFARITGRDMRSLEKLAQDAGIPKTTFLRILRSVDRRLRAKHG